MGRQSGRLGAAMGLPRAPLVGPDPVFCRPQQAEDNLDALSRGGEALLPGLVLDALQIDPRRPRSLGVRIRYILLGVGIT